MIGGNGSGCFRTIRRTWIGKGGYRVVWVWLAAAILLMIAEIFMGTVYLLALAVSALLTAAAAWLWTDNVRHQLLIMAVCSVACMFLLPAALRRTNKKSDGYTNENVRIVGVQGTVIREIAPGRNGIVRLDNGAEWTAKSDVTLSVEEAVIVTDRIGSIAVVAARRTNPHEDHSS
jgi:membrane protein implicated in regulation of membrane protease activity